MEKLKIGSPEMRAAGRTAQKILDLYDSGKMTWSRDWLGSLDSGQCCLLGAEHYVTTGKEPLGAESTCDKETPFRQCFGNNIGGFLTALPGRRVWTWNDHPKRTYKQVRAALKHIVAASKR